MDSVIIIRSNQTPGYAAIEVKAADLNGVIRALYSLSKYTLYKFTHNYISMVREIPITERQDIAQDLGWYTTETGSLVPGKASKIRFLIANEPIDNQVQLRWFSFHSSTRSELDITPEENRKGLSYVEPRKSLVIITPQTNAWVPRMAVPPDYLLLGITPANYLDVLEALDLIQRYSLVVRWDRTGLILVIPDDRASAKYAVTPKDHGLEPKWAIIFAIGRKLGYEGSLVDRFKFSPDEEGLAKAIDNGANFVLLKPGSTAVRILGPEPILNGPVGLIWRPLPVDGRLGGVTE